MGDAIVLRHGSQRIDEIREHEHQIDHRQATEVTNRVEVLCAPAHLSAKRAAADANGGCFARGQVQAAQLRIDRQHHLDLVHRLGKAQSAAGALLHFAANFQQQTACLTLGVAQAGRQRAQRGGNINVVGTGACRHFKTL